MVKKLLLFAFSGLFMLTISCRGDQELGPTWIGGEIINPTSNYVVFAQGDRIIDTVPLDSNNFFLYKSNDLKEGLYVLKHQETQVFYISPGDSLMLHVNTNDFDESLAYSGRGAQKNNLLMELFLLNETENFNLPKWYSLSPENFQKKIDSLKVLKEERYKEYQNNNPALSELFEKTVRASIDYDYYMKRELYALANANRDIKWDPSFFAHRKHASLNETDLRYYYPYYRFLMFYMDNIAAQRVGSSQDRFSYAFSNQRLKAIDSLIKNDSIKNNLSRNTALRLYFNGKEGDENINAFLESFEKVNNNPNHLREVRKVAQTATLMTSGKTIPNLQLLTVDNAIQNLHDIVEKPTVLYFWSYRAPNQATTNHNRAAELKSKYPEYDFFAINTDDHFRHWRKYLETKGYNDKDEYQLENPIGAEHSLLLNNLSKAIIIDKNLKILEGNTSMFHQNFEELLLGYLNRTKTK